MNTWESLPFLLKLRWYADAAGYAVGLTLIGVGIIGFVCAKLHDWWRMR
jgi:hypothetical protein